MNLLNSACVVPGLQWSAFLIYHEQIYHSVYLEFMSLRREKLSPSVSPPPRRPPNSGSKNDCLMENRP